MFKETIIIGCGPAGLQLGYFLNKTNNDYIILEREDKSGSFFSKYPHSKELISINKVYTGNDNKDFNLRHDWNSLLNNHKLEMRKYTKDYYPSSDVLFKYLNDFGIQHKINIQYNTRVYNIVKIMLKGEEVFQIKCLNGKKDEIWLCKKLVVATGLSKKNIPDIKNIDKIKHYADFPEGFFLKKENLQKYVNKKVLILGKGNSSFELSQILNQYCSSIVILGRNCTPRPSICTHYVGDVRSKYFGFYDTFILKSLNAFNHLNEDELLGSRIVETDEGKYYLKTCQESCECQYIQYDEVINCTGWSFDDSMFDESIRPLLDINNKYPIINGRYESYNIENLFFIGALMHSFDYKQSSGGFIHGFRYLIDNFVKINYTNFSPRLFESVDSLSEQFCKRINESSALYQMHGQLCDMFYKIDDKFLYYEGVPLSYICTNKNSKIYLPNTYIFVITLEYGKRIESDLKLIGTRTTSIGTESGSLLLHPVLRVYKNEEKIFNDEDIFYPNYENLIKVSFVSDIVHFDEDLLTDFTNDVKYKNRFYRIIKGYVN